jgi:hypothetical protein
VRVTEDRVHDDVGERQDAVHPQVDVHDLVDRLVGPPAS